MSQATCRFCRKPVLWALTEKNRKPIPLDPGMKRDGNLVAVGRVGDGRMIMRVAPVGSDPAMYLPHMATCTRRRK